MAPEKDMVITVMSRDRVGIVADVTRAVHSLSGNISSISQTVLSTYFTIILIVHFPGRVKEDEVKEAVRSAGGEDELEVSVKLYSPGAPEGPPERCDSFVLSIMGPDKPGIISRISGFLAGQGINIEDLYAYVEDKRFVFIGQLMVPCSMDAGRLKKELEALLDKKGMAVHLQHENIFLATQRPDFRVGGPQ